MKFEDMSIFNISLFHVVCFRFVQKDFSRRDFLSFEMILIYLYLHPYSLLILTPYTIFNENSSPIKRYTGIIAFIFKC